MKNAKSADFSKGCCMIALDRLESKYDLHTALSLLMLKSEFHHSKLESMEKDPNKLILNLEGLQIWMNKFGQKDNTSGEDFMIYVLNNFPEDYNVILDGIENCLMATRDDGLAIDVIWKKLNHWYKK